MRPEKSLYIIYVYDEGGTIGAKKFNAARKVQTKKLFHAFIWNIDNYAFLYRALKLSVQQFMQI